jgi:GDP-mannose 6-dehydrogenase
MGYVGCVSGACLANQGHEVTGVDLDSNKVDLINGGQSPIIEDGLDEIIKEGVAAGRLSARTRAQGLGDVAMVCVGTPSSDNGSLDLQQVIRVCAHIGGLLKWVDAYPIVNIRSTVVPGTVEDMLIPVLETASGKRAGRDFGVCVNPEFLRESTAVKDFYQPPFTVIGALKEADARTVARLYEGIAAPLELVPIKTAEMIKYTCNSFHALKVTFANEVGNLCKALGIDSWRVMDIFCKDNKLNLSPYYLRPGFAFGGSCLPKDLKAIVHFAKRLDVDVPVLAATLASNQLQLDKAFSLIKRTGKTRVGVLGLSFKSGSDDLRESPSVSLIEKLIGKGFQVAIYDDDVSLSELRGKNKQFIERTLPHISSLMKPSLEAVLERSDVLVLCKKAKQFAPALASLNGKVAVVDLVRVIENGAEKPQMYDGICW